MGWIQHMKTQQEHTANCAVSDLNKELVKERIIIKVRGNRTPNCLPTSLDDKFNRTKTCWKNYRQNQFR